jgi:dienelactone hydrolase
VASRLWLLQQPWAAHDRISLIGWANGASAVLWAVRPQLSSRGTEPDFRSAIAFYPDCRISSGLGWSARVPTLLLIGAKDDVSSPQACRLMVDDARGRSALARIVVYPSASHDFDRANLALRTLSGADAALSRARSHRNGCGGAIRCAEARRGMAGPLAIAFSSEREHRFA